MSWNQKLSPLIYGFMPSTLGLSSTIALSATATWVAFSFVPDQGSQLSKVKLYCNTKTGTLASTDCTCDLYSDASGIPNASIESRSSITSAVASATWVEWTGFSTTLTAGTRYWLVFKNANGTPASNFPTWFYSASGLGWNASGVATGVLGWGWDCVQTANSGSAWATQLKNMAVGPRLEFSDGTFAGMPVSDVNRPSGAASGFMAFGKQEVGVKITLPTNASLNIAGLAFGLAKTGTPGAVRFRLYDGTTLLGTTQSIPVANITSNNLFYVAYFSSPIAVTASTVLRAVVGDATSGDTSSNGYGIGIYTVENDSNSKLLKPFGGSMSFTKCTDNTAVSFTETDTAFVPMALLLDTNGEFNSSGGGGLAGNPLGGFIR